MSWPLDAARRSPMAGATSPSISSVCSIITTASAPRGMTPPVAIAVAVPGVTSMAGATPQAITSALSARRFGAPSLEPAVSAARTAKPSTLERSNGGASTGATTSAASTRDSAAPSAKLLPPSGARSMQASKRRRASSADTTSRNCSCRAACLTASRIAEPRALDLGFMAMLSRQPASRLQNLRSRPARRSSRRCGPAIPTINNLRRAVPPRRRRN